MNANPTRTLPVHIHATAGAPETWADRRSPCYLRASIGLLFLVFGGLKLFPGLSPAEGLAGATLHQASFGILDPAISVPLLGVFEMLLGISLLAGPSTGVLFRLTLPVLFLHLAGTALPLVLVPGDLVQLAPGAPLLTLECQYILKNIVLVAAGVALVRESKYS